MPFMWRETSTSAIQPTTTPPQKSSRPSDAPVIMLPTVSSDGWASHDCDVLGDLGILFGDAETLSGQPYEPGK